MGAAVLFFARPWLHGPIRAGVAYDVAAFIILLSDWTIGLRKNAAETLRRASPRDPGKGAQVIIVLCTVFGGLASAITILGPGEHMSSANRGVALTVGVLALALGWLLMHTMFTFRYAHLYYYDWDKDGRPERGLRFPRTREPDDYDFAYFSFTVGMTFQVSDVKITDPGVRVVVLFHGLLSFVYNTAILALGVNLASNLLTAQPN